MISTSLGRSIGMLVLEERGKSVEARKPRRGDICTAVYALIQLIPMGYVTSYKSIGDALGVHQRLVALCLKENRDPIIVPCHRVVYSSRRLGGYSRLGRPFKAGLLELEGVALEEGDVVSPKHFINAKSLLCRSP